MQKQPYIITDLYPCYPAYPPESIMKALSSIESTPNPWQTLKENSKYYVGKNTACKIILKEFKNKDIKEKIKAILSKNRADRTVNGALLLKNINILAPESLATGKHGDNLFILMSELYGPCLHNTIRTFLTHPSGRKLLWKRQLLEKLGQTIGNMHRNRIVHGDLRPNNIVLHVSSKKDLLIGLIDNERTRKAVNFKREKIRNLTQIMMLNEDDVTLTDRYRFFLGYFKTFPHTKKEQRMLLKTIHLEVTKRFQAGSSPLGTIIATEWWHEYLSDSVPAIQAD